MSWAPTLPAAPSRPPVAGWFAYLTNQLTGIPSAEAFGSLHVAVAQYVGLTGIPSAQAVGALALVYRQTITLSGIPSQEAFGGSVFQPGAVNIGLTGIPTAEAVGGPTVTRGAVAIGLAGIGSGEAFGVAVLTTGPVAVALAGIASGETFGALAIAYVVTLGGIPSQESIGALALAYAATLTGIGSGEAFGALNVVGPPQPIQLSGIPTAEAFGGSLIAPGAVNIGLQGIASTEAFGTPAVTTGPVNVALTGIPTAEAFGTLNVQQTVALAGIASQESVGAVTVSQTFPQDVTLPAGIGTAEAVGTPTVTRGAVNVSSVGGIASTEAFGTMAILPSTIVSEVGGIASEEAFGTLTVVAPQNTAFDSASNGAGNNGSDVSWTHTNVGVATILALVTSRSGTFNGVKCDGVAMSAVPSGSIDNNGTGFTAWYETAAPVAAGAHTIALDVSTDGCAGCSVAYVGCGTVTAGGTAKATSTSPAINTTIGTAQKVVSGMGMRHASTNSTLSQSGGTARASVAGTLAVRNVINEASANQNFTGTISPFSSTWGAVYLRLSP